MMWWWWRPSLRRRVSRTRRAVRRCTPLVSSMPVAPEDEDERLSWAVDGHANVVAEVSAALNISRGRAASRLDLAIDLRERLPNVGGEVFAAGDIDYRMVIALVNRSSNVEDPELLARLDAEFARRAPPRWMKLSGPKLGERIDMWVEKSSTGRGARTHTRTR